VLASRQAPRKARGPPAARPKKDFNQCSLLFRGHINWHDYAAGFAALAASTGAAAAPPRVFYLTFLREPVGRAVSEYRHITEGLVAQFGPHTFGAAWDYNFSFDPTRAIEAKRKAGTFDNWLGGLHTWPNGSGCGDCLCVL